MKEAYEYAANRLADPDYPRYNDETEIADAYEQGYKDAIEKACNLLKTMINEIEYYSDDNTPHFDKDEFIKEIRNIMEEQQ